MADDLLSSGDVCGWVGSAKAYAVPSIADLGALAGVAALVLALAAVGVALVRSRRTFALIRRVLPVLAAFVALLFLVRTQASTLWRLSATSLAGTLAAFPVGPLMLATLLSPCRRRTPNPDERAQTEQSLRALFDGSLTLLGLLKPDGTVVEVNAPALSFVGVAREEAIGRRLWEALLALAEGTCREIEADVAAAGEGRFACREIEVRGADGAPRTLEVSLNPVRGEDGSIAFIVFEGRDITQRKRDEERIRHLATHDALTDLPNRSLFRDRLNQALAQARRRRRLAAVLAVDLDHFKRINDTLGHQGGDELLRAVAQRLRSCVRESDTIARIGGDEFAVVQPDLPDLDGAAALARKLVHAVSEPFVVEGREFRPAASIGIALYPDDAGDPDLLLRRADLALYRVKRERRGGFCFYDGGVSRPNLLGTSRGDELRRALERREIVLRLRPRWDLRTGSISALEGLVGWRHPQRGPRAADEFMPATDDSGLTPSIIAWTLREIGRRATRWRRAGLTRVRFAVNVSASQFRSQSFVRVVRAALREQRLDPEALQLEIDGSVLADPPQAAVIDTLGILRRDGVRLCIDDFGIGCPSLATLRRLPIHALKLDRNFLRDFDTEASARAVVSAAIGLGQGLGLRVIAEGVERAPHLDWLIRAGCDEAQGDLLGEPLPVDEALRFLRERSRPRASDGSASARDPERNPDRSRGLW